MEKLTLKYIEGNRTNEREKQIWSKNRYRSIRRKTDRQINLQID